MNKPLPKQVDQKIISPNYNVGTIAELEQALADAPVTGASICVKGGTYDKGSVIRLPDKNDIRIYSEGGAIFIRPDNDPIFRFPGYTANRQIIDNLILWGKETNTYPLIEFEYISLYPTIKNCNFDENNGDFIAGEQYGALIENNNFYKGYSGRIPTDGDTIAVNLKGWVGNIIVRKNVFLTYNTSSGTFVAVATNTSMSGFSGIEISGNFFDITGISKQIGTKKAICYINLAMGGARNRFAVFSRNVMRVSFYSDMELWFEMANDGCFEMKDNMINDARGNPPDGLNLLTNYSAIPYKYVIEGNNEIGAI